ncbi:serine/threonine-protein phosphatase 7 long form [Cinnamomum micranthum f. kanehirae]|uniref:Serine/threonine-protein phosphatase 7 long form n=1 Tax=Cinnamomum micranthum f. kanehirae TaxID=337451 RepID=A0A443PVH9_9MAGN|nr:serine/threonine-protein phosphatase 7 long form [Cinnamomum micranthum f. kanehirae]
MPRRPSRRIGGTSRPTGEDASTSSEPPRVRTKIGVARPPCRGDEAGPSSPPQLASHTIEATGEDDGSDEDAQPSSPQAAAAGDGPIPGGPADLSVLVSIRTHVAISIWDGEERGPLKCISHWRQLKDWYIPLPEDGLDLYVPMFRAIIDESGLADLRRFSYRYISSPLVSAFVERWQPETNTFHMPFGEMTITLDDVRTLIGIPVTGLPIHVSTSMGFTEQVDLLERGLGVDRASAAAELNLARGGVVRMGWIRRVCGDISPASSVEEVECAARGYLLYLLGCTLFTDKSATRVPIYYLSLLMDLTRVRDYAWGAAALAYLYRQLGTATRADVRQIAGYLTLLTSWVYEHFPFTRPPAQWGYTAGMPLASRWNPGQESGNARENIQLMRERLDALHPSEVSWDPYVSARAQHPLHQISFFCGCLRALDVIEPYHPHRVLRQFGYVQTIPSAPLAPIRASRGTTAGKYKVSYAFLDQYWVTWEDHVLSLAHRGRRVSHAWECSSDYIEWYTRTSHTRVQNPARHSHYDPNEGRDDMTPRTIHRAKDHIRATLARTDEPSDFYIRALQTTLEILDGLPVTYRRRS